LPARLADQRMSFGFDDLAGRRVLVTGGSSGIGAAVALAFAQCGANIAIHYRKGRDRAEAVRHEAVSAGGRAITVGGDLGQSKARDRVAAEAVGLLGGLDILVNNAGDLIERRSLEQSDDAL